MVLELLFGRLMNPTDKKTTALALSEQPHDTEAILLERLKNSSDSEDYFRWMLFVVGFYRVIYKIDAATDLLEGFIMAVKDSEQSAHCYLSLGQCRSFACCICSVADWVCFFLHSDGLVIVLRARLPR